MKGNCSGLGMERRLVQSAGAPCVGGTLKAGLVVVGLVVVGLVGGVMGAKSL